MTIQDSHADFGTFVLNGLGNPTTGLHARGFIGQRALPLHAMIASGGYEQVTNAQYDWHGMKRGSTEFALIQCTIAGQGQLTIAGESYRCIPGTLMLLTFPDDNRYWLAEGDQWDHCYLCLHGREILRAWTAAIRQRGPLWPISTTSATLQHLVMVCQRIMNEQLTSPFEASALAYQLAMTLLSESGHQAAASQRNPAIDLAKQWAKRHATTAIGVDDLARIAGLSRHHFSRQFAKSEGISPAAYITDVRMRQALRLLRDAELAINDIAQACGYDDPAYFCRVFRRSIGVSPGEFRSSGMY